MITFTQVCIPFAAILQRPIQTCSNCSRNVPDEFQTCSTCSRNVPEMFQTCSRNPLGMFQKCFENVPDMFQKCPEKNPQTPPEKPPEMSQKPLNSIETSNFEGAGCMPNSQWWSISSFWTTDSDSEAQNHTAGQILRLIGWDWKSSQNVSCFDISAGNWWQTKLRSARS